MQKALLCNGALVRRTACCWHVLSSSMSRNFGSATAPNRSGNEALSMVCALGAMAGSVAETLTGSCGSTGEQQGGVAVLQPAVAHGG